MTMSCPQSPMQVSPPRRPCEFGERVWDALDEHAWQAMRFLPGLALPLAGCITHSWPQVPASESELDECMRGQSNLSPPSTAATSVRLLGSALRTHHAIYWHTPGDLERRRGVALPSLRLPSLTRCHWLIPSAWRV